MRIISWLAQSMRWVVITALGMPVEPEVKRNFAIVSGVTLALAASIAARRRGRGKILEQRARRGSGSCARSSGVVSGIAAAIAVAKRSPSLA